MPQAPCAPGWAGGGAAHPRLCVKRVPGEPTRPAAGHIYPHRTKLQYFARVFNPTKTTFIDTIRLGARGAPGWKLELCQLVYDSYNKGAIRMPTLAAIAVTCHLSSSSPPPHSSPTNAHAHTPLQ